MAARSGTKLHGIGATEVDKDIFEVTKYAARRFGRSTGEPLNRAGRYRVIAAKENRYAELAVFIGRGRLCALTPTFFARFATTWHTECFLPCAGYNLAVPKAEWASMWVSVNGTAPFCERVSRT